MSELQSSIPSKENKAFFIKVVSGHSKVQSIHEISDQLYEIALTNNTAIIAYLTNKYIIGIADYLDFIEESSNLNCIVTTSAWNSYTDDAKQRSVENQIGLFDIADFLGALHQSYFWNYVKKDN